jgi:hypothetical protein
MNEITHRLKTARAEFRNAQRATRCCCLACLLRLYPVPSSPHPADVGAALAPRGDTAVRPCARQDAWRGVAWRCSPSVAEVDFPSSTAEECDSAGRVRLRIEAMGLVRWPPFPARPSPRGPFAFHSRVVPMRPRRMRCGRLCVAQKAIDGERVALTCSAIRPSRVGRPRPGRLRSAPTAASCASTRRCHRAPNRADGQVETECYGDGKAADRAGSAASDGAQTARGAMMQAGRRQCHRAGALARAWA